MNRKLIKILTIIFITITVMLITNSVFAESGSELAKKFNGNNVGTISTNDGETILQKVIGPVLSVVRIVTVGISVIMITYLGIKYMAAAPSEKANIKNQLITFTIGAVIAVGAVTLLGIIKNFADSTIT